MSETPQEHNQIPADPFVAEQVKLNDEAFGGELRERFGDELIDESNAFVSKLTKAQFESIMDEQIKIYAILASMMRAGEGADSDVVHEMLDRHVAFLKAFGDEYSYEAYRALGETYKTDNRFVEFFDEFEPGMARWFNAAIQNYCDQHENAE